MSPKDFLRKFKVDVEKFLEDSPPPEKRCIVIQLTEESQNPVEVEARG